MPKASAKPNQFNEHGPIPLEVTCYVWLGY